MICILLLVNTDLHDMVNLHMHSIYTSHCCKVYNGSLSIFTLQNQPKDEAHLFPFICAKDSASELGQFYLQIRNILVEIHNTQKKSQCSQEFIDQLVSLAKERYSF